MTEHDAMLEAFCEYHGQGREYQTGAEHDQWLAWLGCFTLGWDAHKRYVGIPIPAWALIFLGALIGNIIAAAVVLILRP